MAGLGSWVVTGVTLNQTLHGYADGHQLLASSIELTSEQQALLLVMSDLSGPTFRSGFESYLTGYPLQNTGHYCFARTWFAPEMPRPGCVWTHTFLIRGEDLPRIQKLERLNRYFRRPNAPDDILPYRDRLLFQEDAGDYGQQFADDARPLLASLYGTDKRIVVPSNNSIQHEAVSLALYDQQWPRLRRGFRFCTGALAWRDSEFDLSICPPEETHSIGGSGMVLDESREINRSFEGWVELAQGDLRNGSGSEYRRFLWQFGSDYGDGRAAFRPLTEIFELLSLPNNGGAIAEKVLSAVAHYFPDSENSRRLKSDLFGRDGRYLPQLGGDLAITKVLVTHPAASALAADVAAIRDRSLALVKKDIEAATDLALAAAQVGGENAQAYLDAYFDRALDSEEALERAPSSLLFDILERQPALLARPILWSRLNQLGLVNRAISRFSKEPIVLTDGIAAMMTAGAWDALAGVVEQIGAPALKQIFQVIDGKHGSKIDYPDELYRTIWSRQTTVTAMLENDEIAGVPLKMLTAEIDPRSYHLRGIGLSTWQPVTNVKTSFSDPMRTNASAIFLLYMGLASRSKNGISLIAASFSTVYQAAGDRMLENSLWDRLGPSLAWYSPNWDKCARLVRTVARAFKERDWPSSFFPLTFVTDEQFLRALGEIDEMWRGDRYIRRLKAEGQESGIEWSSSQLAAFGRYI